ncbi:hypothetical protein [Bradyrhizobium genosp. A]|uniref:hypothetical protein n=1 Tax=Bradyrhizobium genosp. A TaxID=83626 RepID=UPI003CF8258C
MPAPAQPEGIEKMDAEAKILTHAVRSNADVDEFKSVAIFCGLGLLLSLVATLSYGLDLAAFL